MKEGRSIEHPAIASRAILQVTRLNFSYAERELFAGWSTRIPPGVTLVRGGESSGKTTLLRLLAGELPVQGGDLQIGDIHLGQQGPAYRQQVFRADPRSTDFDQITPLDYFKTLQRRYPGFDDQMVDRLIEGLSLAPHRDKPLYMLSTGSKRKVWLTAAFASGAAVTLLDEPFASLDKSSIDFVKALLHDAANHPTRAWVLADYEMPTGVPLAAIIDL
ncbi:MAG: ABC transporter ATP-binding protein [Rhodoferax sp.]